MGPWVMGQQIWMDHTGHGSVAYIRHNVLMRHKNDRQLGNRHIRHSHGLCVMGHTRHGSVEWWVTYVVGHKI